MILLTGATGYLGSRLAKRLSDGGRELTLLKRSTSSMERLEGLAKGVTIIDMDRTSLDGIFANAKPETVVHCATDYGRTGASPSTIKEANFAFPLRLLEAAIRARTRAFINTDSMLDPNVSLYASTKRQFADALKTRASDIAAINIALEHFYGPGDDESKFVARMASELASGVDSIALTPGEQKRDFIYIDDVVDAFVALIERVPSTPHGFHSYQAGTGKTTSIRALMALLVELTGNTRTQMKFGAIPYRPHEAMDAQVDISALKALGWSAKTPLIEGLRRTIEASAGVKIA